MKNFIVTENITPDIKNTSLALGFFDGIHIAHQKVLQSALAFSQKLDTKSTIITFKNHPMEILSGLTYDFITTPEERIEAFKAMGFDVVIMTDFTMKLATMNAEDYFKNVILNLAPKSISIGYNHNFGSKKSGNSAFLLGKSKEFGFQLDITQKMSLADDSTISSTNIKNIIKLGEIEEANKILFKPFSIKNVVEKGMQRGRSLGFPTANLEFPDKKIAPSYGVYAGFTKINDKKYPSVANVGVRPTFSDIEKPLIEIHILEFNKNLYNEIIQFEFVKKIRAEMKFSNIDALCSQIVIDKKQALDFLNK